MTARSEHVWGTLDPFIEPGPMLGRRVANERFLEALLNADPFGGYHFFIQGGSARRTLRSELKRRFPGLEDKILVTDPRELPERMAQTTYHCFHQSDCIASQTRLQWLRNDHSPDLFPVTGLIHSLSYQHYPERFLSHLSPSTTPRDAIVCTSRSGREAVARLFGMLRDGYGLDEQAFPAPGLPRIPLGVDVGSFVTRQHVDEGPCRFLVFGRISHYSKMDLIPLLRAFQRMFADGIASDAAELVLAGWTEDGDDFLPTLKELARNIGLDMTVVERPDEEEKTALFAEADAFISIADNPQETFGLTVIEAAASGIPAVVSDYDGYRDLVKDGVTGFRIPVTGPAATPQVDAMAPLSFDSAYHLALAQETAVDTPKLADALGRLVRDPALRRGMGHAARQRSEAVYDWPQVIEQYLKLWDELRSRPVDVQAVRQTVPPARLRYGEMFSHYATRSLDDDMLLRAGRTGHAVYRKQEFVLPYAGVERLVAPDHARQLAFHARKPVTCGELARKLMRSADATRETADYAILWALKHDILERAD
jgi:glycosyltransferase involved in cell wall biosynthesis